MDEHVFPYMLERLVDSLLHLTLAWLFTFSALNLLSVRISIWWKLSVPFFGTPRRWVWDSMKIYFCLRALTASIKKSLFWSALEARVSVRVLWTGGLRYETGKREIPVDEMIRENLRGCQLLKEICGEGLESLGFLPHSVSYGLWGLWK